MSYMNSRRALSRHWSVCVVAIIFTFLAGVVRAATYYLDPDGGGDGSTWDEACPSWQELIEMEWPLEDGDVVLCSNGVYDVGGIKTPGGVLTNRFCITNAVTVIAVNGPEVTFIKGQSSGGGLGPNASRCVFMTNGAKLIGFTLTNGHTASSGNLYADRSGGGLYMSENCVASNLVVIGNSVNAYGAGVVLVGGGQLLNSLICTNTAGSSGGGVALVGGGTVSACRIRGNSSEGSGGGVYCVDPGGVVNNCIIQTNLAVSYGGAAHLYQGGTLNNCWMINNWCTWPAESYGGGILFENAGGTANNCTVSDNNLPAANSYGGGVCFAGGGVLNNSIVYNNSGQNNNDINDLGGGSVRYTCASDGITHGMDGCITNNPQFADAANGDYTLQSDSPCIGVGDNTYAPTNATPYDLAGNPRIIGGTVDMGAYERQAGPPPDVVYVDASVGSSGSGTNWATAFKTIQEGVDAVSTTGTVWVTNGVYDVGVKPMPGYTCGTRVVITNAITLRSVNGPGVTIIQGAADTTGGSASNGPSAVRGVYMAAGTLNGFTITNGWAMDGWSTVYSQDREGGGIWMTNGVVTNCVISGCRSYGSGGGIAAKYNCEVRNSEIYGNVATSGSGGGAIISFSSVMQDCHVYDNWAASIAGGVYVGSAATANNCIVERNRSAPSMIMDPMGAGGMLVQGTANNCLVASNSTTAKGGGATVFGAGMIRNCTIADNTGDTDAGGVYFYNAAAGRLGNSIVYGNNVNTNTFAWNTAAVITNCCAPDGVTNGVNGCVTNDPGFAANYRLTQDSPCLNGGANVYAPTNAAPYDLAGNPRIVFGVVDMGAYELQHVVSPSAGPYGGGNSITITNGNLGDGSDITNVAVGGVAATITGQGENWVEITLGAASSAGAKDIVIQSASVGETTFAGAYTVNPAGEIGGTTYDWAAWQEVAGLPKTVYYTHGAVLNGAYYIVGGHVDTVIQTNVFRFDGTNWTEVAGLPAARRNAAIGTYSNAIYCIAGHNSSSDETNTVFKFDGTSWTTVAPLPTSRYSFSAKAYNGYLYAIAGNPTPRTNVYRYDGAVWEEVAGTPSNQVNAAATVAGGYLYSAGGYQCENAFRFDGTNWTDIGAMPDVVNFGSGGTLNDQPYVYGGYDASLARTTNVFRYDGTNWEQIVGFPEARYGFAGGEYNGSIYVVGGYNNVAKTNVYRYPGQTANPGVAPSSASIGGGCQIAISGTNLGSGVDITNVTLCGVSATNIASQSATQVVVWAGSRGSGATGDVVVYSTSYGATTKANGFSYTGETMRVVLYNIYMQVVDGGVSVCWRTASEENTVGFDLFRWNGKDWVKVNSALIPATGEMGGSYCVADAAANGTDTFVYKLVEIETDGGVQEYGPYEVAASNPRLENLAATPEGVVLRWLSREGDVYGVQKATDVRSGFAPLATGLPATPPVNVHTDATETGRGAYYRVVVE